MASLLKAMALVAYLNLPSVRDRPLHDSDRRLLGPMIRRSDNATASTVLRTVGAGRLYRLAERAEMRAFSFVWPVWGLEDERARPGPLLLPHRPLGHAPPPELRATAARGHRRVAALGNPAGASGRLDDPLQGRLGIRHRPRHAPVRAPGERRPAARALDPHALEPEPRLWDSHHPGRGGEAAEDSAPALTNENEEPGSLTSAGCGDRRG